MVRIALALWLSFGMYGPAAAQNTVDQARDLIRRDRYDAAARLLAPLAALGNVDAQHEFGRAMVYSPETTGDAFDEGLRWLQKAIDGGSVDALHTLGRVLLFGSAGAVASDPAKGIVLLEKAASRGHAPANEALGELYLQGKRVPADGTKSCDYFRRAFEADRASGASGLERCYRTGEGMARDARQALALYALMRIDSLQHGPEQERLRAEVGRDVLAAADKDAARWRSRKVRRLPDWQIPLVPIAGDARALAERALQQVVFDQVTARTRRPWALDAIADRYTTVALSRSGTVFGSEAWWKSFATLRPRLRSALAEAYGECGRSARLIVRQRDLARVVARGLPLFELSDAVAVLESRLGRAADQFLLEFEMVANRAQQRLLEIGADLSLETLAPRPIARLRELREQGRVPELTRADYFAASDFFEVAGAHPAFRFSLGTAMAADEIGALMSDDLRRLDRTLPLLDRERAVLLGRYPPIDKIRAAAKSGLEEIEQACEALGKRLVHDLVEQFAARPGR